MSSRREKRCSIIHFWGLDITPEGGLAPYPSPWRLYFTITRGGCEEFGGVTFTMTRLSRLFTLSCHCSLVSANWISCLMSSVMGSWIWPQFLLVELRNLFISVAFEACILNFVSVSVRLIFMHGDSCTYPWKLLLKSRYVSCFLSFGSQNSFLL